MIKYSNTVKYGLFRRMKHSNDLTEQSSNANNF